MRVVEVTEQELGELVAIVVEAEEEARRRRWAEDQLSCDSRVGNGFDGYWHCERAHDHVGHHRAGLVTWEDADAEEAP